MSPFHVESDFGPPIAVRRRKNRTARLVYFDERRRIGQAESQAELVQIVGDARIVEGIDNGDGRAGAIARNLTAAEKDLVESVGVANLGRSVAGRPWTAERARAAVGRQAHMKRTSNRRDLA